MIERFGDGRDWFFEKRFGLFVHWGLYAIEGWHEQDQWRRRIPRAEYAKLQARWNPVRFDPDRWLDLMAEAGMEYLCLTAKHHDGFCLWDTRQTAFNTMNTPYGRDVVGMLAQACQRRGVPLCLYYSCVDWRHRNYPNQGRHHELPPQPGDAPDLAEYLAFLRAQVRELCTHYGEISGFWWDMNVDRHADPSINEMIRKLQPRAVINNRGYDCGDFGTPEREFEKDERMAFDRPTEANNSVGVESWGFRANEDYYSDAHLIRSIDRYLARDANYLLNVGPTAAGEIAPEAAGMLRRIGRWYARVREAFVDARPCSELTRNRSVLLTGRANAMYVHLHREPVSEGVNLKPIDVAPVTATLLNTGEPVRFVVDMFPWDHLEQRPFLHLQKLPVNRIANEALVVKLVFDRPVAALQASVTADESDLGRR